MSEEQAKPEPETTSEQLAEIEQQADSVWVCEGWWRTRRGEVKYIRAGGSQRDTHYSWPWTDGLMCFQDNGCYQASKPCDNDLVEYLGLIEPEPEPEPQPQPQPQPQEQRESDAELRIRLLKQCNDNQAETIKRLMAEARDLNMEIGGLQRQTEQQKGRIDFLEAVSNGNNAALQDYKAQVAKLQGLVDTARQQLEAAATERDELRAAIDAADKQLDQKDAQICDLRIELEAAQQVPQPVSDEEREQIWDQATEQAGQLVIRWLRPLTGALIKQPDERFCRFMAMTLSILPDILPELLGYAVEDQSLDNNRESE